MSNDDSYFELRADFIDAFSTQELKIIRDTLVTNKDSVRAKLYAIISDPTNDNYIDNTAIQEMFINDSYSFDLSFEAFYIDNNYNTISQSIPVYEPPPDDQVVINNSDTVDVDYSLLQIKVLNTIPNTTLASLSQNQQDIITQSYIDNYVTLFTTIAGVTDAQIRPNISSKLKDNDDGSSLNIRINVSNFQTEAQYTSASNLIQNLPADFLTNVTTTITTKFQELVNAAATQAADDAEAAADAQAAQETAEKDEADARAAQLVAAQDAADALAAQQDAADALADQQDAADQAAAAAAAAEAAASDFSNVEQTYENTLVGVELDPDNASSDEDLTTIAIYKDSYVQTYEEKIKEQLIAIGEENTDLVNDNIVIEFVPDPDSPGNTKVKVTVQNVADAEDLATINTIIKNLNSGGTIASEVQNNVDTAIEKRQTASIDTKIGGTFADLDTTETDAIIAKAKEQVAANFSIPADNITVTLEEDPTTGEIVVKTSMIGVKNREKQSLESTTNQTSFESALTTAITSEPALQEVANDANNPIVVDSEPPAPPKEAKIEMKLTGVNLNTLPASAKSAIENNAKANVASSFGVPLDTISVILQQGSVNIVIKVLNPPADSAAAFDPPAEGSDPNQSPAGAFLSSFVDAVTNDPSLDIPGFEPVFPNPADFVASAVTAPVSLPPITLKSTSFEIPITSGDTDNGDPSLEDLTPTDKAALIQQTIDNVTDTFDVDAEDVVVTIFEDPDTGAIILKTFVENAETGTDAAQALDSSSNMVDFAANVSSNLANVKENSTNPTFREAPPPTIEAPAPAAPVVVNVPVTTVVVAIAVVDDSGSTTPVSGDITEATAAVQTAKDDAFANATDAVATITLLVESAQKVLSEANEASSEATTAASEALTLLETTQDAVANATASAVAAAQTATASAEEATATVLAANSPVVQGLASNALQGTTGTEEPTLEEVVGQLGTTVEELREVVIQQRLKESGGTLTRDDIIGVEISLDNNGQPQATVTVVTNEANAQAIQEALGVEIDRFLIPFVGRGIKVIPNASSSMGIADKRRAAIAAGKKNNSVANNPTPSAQFSFLRGRLRRARSSGAVAPRKTNYR
jgi:hypothetical protein